MVSFALRKEDEGLKFVKIVFTFIYEWPLISRQLENQMNLLSDYTVQTCNIHFYFKLQQIVIAYKWFCVRDHS